MNHSKFHSMTNENTHRLDTSQMVKERFGSLTVLMVQLTRLMRIHGMRFRLLIREVL
jgi:hypothetical protein